MTLWRSAAIGGAVALSFGAGLYMARFEGPASVPVVTERVVVERPGPLVASRGPSLDEIRAVMREEMERRASDEPLPAIPPARAEEGRMAVAKINATVAEGLRRGVWSDRERAELRSQLGKLGTAELHEVLSPLFQAINAQRLRLDGPLIW